MAEDSLAILPSSMGRQPPGQQPKKADARKFIPAQKGGLLLSDPKEEECPYTFSDSAAYLRNKKAEESAKRAAELEGKDETRGFLRSVEELARKQQWEEAYQFLERRTAVPSGLFLVTRAVLRWKFGRHRAALADVERALEQYASSAKAGPLAAAFACFARICLGSQVRDKSSCSKEMRPLVEAWEKTEEEALRTHALGQGLFHPKKAERLPASAAASGGSAALELEDGMQATDGTYLVASGVRVAFTFLRGRHGAQAPLIVHFHGDSETAAMYREPELAGKYRELGVHLLVSDFRGYGWSDGEPSLATCLLDAEALAEKLPSIVVEQGLPWPYPGGLILSGRSVGAQLAVHLSAMYPNLFRSLILDSAAATAATGDRLGRAPQRASALECWRQELEKASLEILQPLDAELRCLSAVEKLHCFAGRLLVMHGLNDELVPFEGSESLHAAAGTRTKELVLIEEAGHNNIGRFDAYWSAIRRLCSTAQLDSSLPSVGESVEHLCAICAAKAASKCGRCQKVWYCGRGHQAEHWKVHKLTCAGGPPEPKAKEPPAEADAQAVGLLFARIGSSQDVTDLTRTLASLAAQEGDHRLRALHVAWAPPRRRKGAAAPSPPPVDGEEMELSSAVSKAVKDFEASVGGGTAVVVSNVDRNSGPLDHALAAIVALPADESSASTWVKFLSSGELYSPSHLAVAMPALRRASADARSVAVSCSRHTRSSSSSAPAPADAAGVDALLASKEAELCDEELETSLGELTVRLPALRSFLESTPALALAHPLCALRLRRKLAAAFGKKVQTCVPPEGAWMRWVPTSAAGGAAQQAKEQGEEQEERRPTEADRSSAASIHDTLARTLAAATRSAAEAGGEGGGGDGEDGSALAAREAAPAEAQEPPPMYARAAERLGSLEAAERELAGIRWRTERSLILRAGEEVPAKELRDTASEFVHAFLEDVGLDEAVGIERWARETSASIASEAAGRFSIKVVDGRL